MLSRRSPPRQKDMRYSKWFIGLLLGLSALAACQKERAFVGIWRAEEEREQTTDIHNVFIFGDMTCSWNDSILDKTDSTWRITRMGGTAVLIGRDELHATFTQKIPVADTEIPDTIIQACQYTFHREDDRQLYCDETDTYFEWVRRLR